MSTGDSNTFLPQIGFVAESGITEDHFKKFQEAAQEEQVIALVRHTNRKSTELIKKGCPGKPLNIKFHTSDTTGVVTAANSAEVNTARDAGYLVVDADRLARGYIVQNGRRVEVEQRLQNAFWKVEPRQLIDPKLRKPLVGDYDLMGVVNPRNPGQNISLVASNGNVLADTTSPIVRQYAERVNAKLDMPRVLHGAQDQYKPQDPQRAKDPFTGFRGGATVFLPNGQVIYLADEAAVRGFYDLVGRQTRVGQYLSRPMPIRRDGINVVPGRQLTQRLRARAATLGRNAGAVEFLGQSLGSAIQWLGDVGIRRNIQKELQSTHAKTIEDHLLNGNGVLVIVCMQEWYIPDFNGMRARGLLGVYIEAGRTQQAAMDNWMKPKLMKAPPWGWRTYAQYIWIDPAY
jgi:hypothetical protein